MPLRVLLHASSIEEARYPFCRLKPRTPDARCSCDRACWQLRRALSRVRQCPRDLGACGPKRRIHVVLKLGGSGVVNGPWAEAWRLGDELHASSSASAG
eukprot:CAMPEP_0119422172 /NCGR_PEP_ID=MMETSP1335-20130426/27565_1 /TAXON_ID=259385 /ORGANISM="Chrysoculter rhomboideus, Strain RCC1486" /LENGTH=98 /DNA_ID=CAMNT_0007447611 /DNA_START=51 /DNA_END=345 /DNA_ORIENTATION=+